MMRGRPSMLRGAVGLLRGAVYVALALPPLIVVASSFSRTTFLTFPPRGFTLQWYGRAAQSRAFMDSLLLSTELAIAATGLALLIGRRPPPPSFADDSVGARSFRPCCSLRW
jgi:putative spermidine/putrescine transport system permease protein